MSSSAPAETPDIRVRAVSVTDAELSVGLMDGRSISVPLAWYPVSQMPHQPSGPAGRSPAAATAFIGRKSTRT
jgi:hypothetical protein